MSRPISLCRIFMAANEPARRPALKTDLQYNLKFGAMTLYGCRHQPHCEIPDQAALRSLFEDVPELWPLFNE